MQVSVLSVVALVLGCLSLVINAGVWIRLVTDEKRRKKAIEEMNKHTQPWVNE